MTPHFGVILVSSSTRWWSSPGSFNHWRDPQDFIFLFWSHRNPSGHPSYGICWHTGFHLLTPWPFRTTPISVVTPSPLTTRPLSIASLTFWIVLLKCQSSTEHHEFILITVLSLFQKSTLLCFMHIVQNDWDLSSIRAQIQNMTTTDIYASNQPHRGINFSIHRYRSWYILPARPSAEGSASLHDSAKSETFWSPLKMYLHRFTSRALDFAVQNTPS